MPVLDLLFMLECTLQLLTQLSEMALMKETTQCLLLYYSCRIMEIVYCDVKGVLV